MQEVVAIICLLLLGVFCLSLGIGYAHDAWITDKQWMTATTPGKFISTIILLEGSALIFVGIVKMFS